MFAASLSAPGALMQVPARRDAVLGCAAIVAKAGHKPSSDKKRFGQSKGQSAPPRPYLQPNARRAWVPGVRGLRMRTQRRMSNFTRLDPGRLEIAILVDAMLPAREAVPTRPGRRHSGLLRLNVTWPPRTCSMWCNAGMCRCALTARKYRVPRHRRKCHQHQPEAVRGNRERPRSDGIEKYALVARSAATYQNRVDWLKAHRQGRVIGVKQT